MLGKVSMRQPAEQAAPVIAKVERQSGDTYPRVGFIVTIPSRPAEWAVVFETNL
jgi:hypothetical protein